MSLYNNFCARLIATGKATLNQIFKVGFYKKDKKRVSQAFIKQINLDKFDFADSIKIGKWIDDLSVWRTIVSRIDFNVLDIKGIIEISYEIHSSYFWKALIETGKLDIPTMVKINQDKYATNLVETITKQINFDRLTDGKILKIGYELGTCSWDFWKIAIEKIDLSQFFLKDLLEQESKINDYSFSRAVAEEISSRDVTSEDLEKMGNRANDIRTWEILIKSKKLTPEKMLELGNKFDTHKSAEDLWETIIRTGKINTATMVEICSKTNKYSKDNLVLWIDGEPSKDDIFLGDHILHNNFGLWCAAAETGMFDFKFIMILGKKLHEGNFWLFNVNSWGLTDNKNDFALNQLKEIGNETKNWGMLFDTGKFSDEEMVEICEQMKDKYLWMKVIKNGKNFSDYDIIEMVLKSRDDYEQIQDFAIETLNQKGLSA